VIILNKKIKITKKESLKGDDGHKTFSIRVPDYIVEHLELIAKKTNRSRNEVINMFLEYSVENWELEEK
jgi:predicted DNA-binding protein